MVAKLRNELQSPVLSVQAGRAAADVSSIRIQTRPSLSSIALGRHFYNPVSEQYFHAC
jgi:hypothetical protein